MKAPRKLIGTVLLLMLVGSVGFTLAKLYVRQREAYCTQLTVEGNRQTDLLGPFIQGHGLAKFPPDEAVKNDFNGYLNQQIALKRVGKAEAEKILEELQANGQALPVYTFRGWVMPLIAQEFQK